MKRFASVWRENLDVGWVWYEGSLQVLHECTTRLFVCCVVGCASYTCTAFSRAFTTFTDFWQTDLEKICHRRRPSKSLIISFGHTTRFLPPNFQQRALRQSERCRSAETQPCAKICTKKQDFSCAFVVRGWCLLTEAVSRFSATAG